MTEQERYTIEKDIINEKLCIWDYDDLLCEIDDDKTLTTLVNLLNKLHQEIEYWKEKHLQEVEKNSTISATIDNHNNWHDNRCVFLKQIKELKKENQQLKEFVRYMGFTIEKENENNIRFVYKDLKR